MDCNEGKTMLRSLLLMVLLLSLALTDTVSGQRTDSPGGKTILDCPHKCVCYFKTVRCMSQKLKVVPKLPAGTAVLDMRFNHVSDLRPGGFQGSQELHTILLNDNHLRYLRKDTFAGLPHLRILYLYNNYIESIESGAFNGLPKLEQLYLHHNRLTDIKKGTFNDLPVLERLFLQSNKLHKLPANAFENVGPMTRLRLDSNALVCDCNVMWLVKRLQEKPLEMAAVCQGPDEMKGRSLSSMSTSDFHCSKPHIMEGPEDIQVSVGSPVTLTCRVYGDPQPEVKWMLNSNEIDIDGRDFHLQEDGSLVISKMSENLIGDYVCVAVNEMGSTKSRNARALVTVSPNLRFVQLPESKTVKSGTNVVFFCRVEGYPSPGIEWWKNGQIVRETNRVFLEDKNETLKVLAVKESDSARYICRATNVNGFAETAADLKVLSSSYSLPKIIIEPNDMEVEPGTTIAIPCRAEGNPKPVIQWKKDGTAIEVDNKRRHLARTGSLVLYNLTVLDTGRYECSAINEYGRATGHSLLKVRPLITESGSRIATDAIVFRAFQDAKDEIDRAINRTLISLFHGNDKESRRPVDPFRLARYPNAAGRAAAKPAEIVERTLVNVRRMVNAGIQSNVTGEFHYQEILSPEQVREIEKWSGCTAHRFLKNCSDMCYHKKYRSIDGTCNNLENPTWGSSYTGFRRIVQPIYENGFSLPVGWSKDKRYFGFDKPAARLVSTSIISTHEVTPDSKITHMTMQWGQFLDHDLDHSLPAVSSESWDGIDCKKSCENAAPCFPMEVPPNDPRINNRRCIDFFRTSAVCGSGETSVLWGGLTPREQLNQLTSYIDASQVYGYNDELAQHLREFGNDLGLLREGPSIPGHKAVLPSATNFGSYVDCRRNVLESSVNCFLTGDFRANEQVGLLAMHTVWMREHNRIARELKAINAHWTGEKIYQESRKIVGAQMQRITFEHWLPRIFGRQEYMDKYRGYDPKLDASISNVFATAALRFGHSLIQPRLQRLDGDFRSIPQGPLSLRDAFFSPWRLVDEGGVDPLLRGMFGTPAKLKLPEQNLNDELTEQLFRTAHAVALDLAAMNIQRSRDHGLPGYLEYRKFCNLSHVESFEDLAGAIRSSKVRQKLRELYGHPGNIDVWVGGILEDQVPDAKVGPLFHCLLLEQFKRLRDGDRFWYENEGVFKEEQLKELKKSSLARVLCDNGDNITLIQRDVFLLDSVEGNEYVPCSEIPRMDLRMWSDCSTCDGCSSGASDDFLSIRSRRHLGVEKYLEKSNKPYEQIRVLERMVRETKEESKVLNKRVNELKRSVRQLKTILSRENN